MSLFFSGEYYEKHKSFIINFLIASTSIAMEAPAPQEPTKFSAKEVAKRFSYLMFDGLSMEEEDSKMFCGDLGRSLKSDEFGNQVYWYALSPEKLKKSRALEVKQLFNFLRGGDGWSFLHRVARINCRDFIKRDLKHPCLATLKYNLIDLNKASLLKNDSTSHLIVTNNKVKDEDIQQVFWAAVFPKPNRPTIEINPLLLPSEDVKQAFKQIIALDEEIMKDLKKLYDAWKVVRTNWKEGVGLIQKEGLGPYLFRKNLSPKKELFSKNRDFVQNSLAHTSKALVERKKALEYIEPTPLNAMLLYAFYLFEEEGVRLEQLDVSIPGYGNVLPFYYMQEDASPITWLAPIAHEVLESLGFHLAEPMTQSQRQSIFQNATIKNKPQGGTNQVCKKKKKNKTAQIIHKKEIPVEQKISPSIIPQEEKAESPAADITEGNNTNKEQESPCLRKKAPKIFSCLFGEPVLALERTRGHRAFDMLAFLLRHGLYEHAKGNNAGTIAVALRKNDENIDELVFATKHNLAPDVIIDVFSQMVKNEILSGKPLFDSSLKKKLRLQIATHEACMKNAGAPIEQRMQATNDALRDRAHLYVLRMRELVTAPKDALEKRIAALLTTKGNLAIEVIANPFRLHPELKLVDNLLANKSALGVLTKEQGEISYQYIGCSMLNCASCGVALRGDKSIRGINQDAKKNNLVFFSKGTYSVFYPGFYVPDWLSKANNCKKACLYKQFQTIGENKNNVEKLNLHLLQMGDVSESEEEAK